MIISKNYIFFSITLQREIESTVVFNDQKTNVKEMIKALKQENFQIEGEPKFLM